MIRKSLKTLRSGFRPSCAIPFRQLSSQQYAPYEIQQVEKNFTATPIKPLSLNIKKTSTEESVPVAVESSIPSVDFYDKPGRDVWPVAEAKRHNISTSLRKMQFPAAAVKKKHILDAIVYLEASDLKASKIVLNLLLACRRNAEVKGLDPTRLYVKDFYYGRQAFRRKLRYRAKGRADILMRPRCMIHLIVEEKPLEEFFIGLLEGNASAGFAAMVRHHFRQQEVSYEQIREFQFLLTAKGRQQRRLQLKRRVQLQMTENERNGVYLKKEKVLHHLLREEANTLASKYQSARSATHLEGYESRLAIFKRNQKNSD